jgi:hypothetical protein
LLETLHAHNNNWFFAPFLTGFPPDSAKIDSLFLSLPMLETQMTLAPSTIKAYESRLKILKAIEPPLDFNDPVETINQLKGLSVLPTTLKTYYSAIIYAIGKENPSAHLYRKEIKDVTESVKSVAKEQKLSEKEEKKYLPWSDIIKATNEIVRNPSISDMDKLLVQFYTSMPPVRADYANLEIVKRKTDKATGNYIQIMKSGSIIRINQHKTSKTYGAIVKEVPDQLAKKLYQYTVINPSLKVLFPMTENALGKRVQKLYKNQTGKEIGITALRHSYISGMRKNDMSLKDKEWIAKEMGNSLSEQELYRKI